MMIYATIAVTFIILVGLLLTFGPILCEYISRRH